MKRVYVFILSALCILMLAPACTKKSTDRLPYVYYNGEMQDLANDRSWKSKYLNLRFVAPEDYAFYRRTDMEQVLGNEEEGWIYEMMAIMPPNPAREPSRVLLMVTDISNTDAPTIDEFVKRFEVVLDAEEKESIEFLGEQYRVLYPTFNNKDGFTRKYFIRGINTYVLWFQLSLTDGDDEDEILNQFSVY
jgi:hypothetical protein